MFRACVLLTFSLLLAGCQIESRATMSVSQVRAAASGGASQPITVDFAVEFPTQYFCGNYKDKTLGVLRQQFGSAQFVECKKVQRKDFGYYRIATQIVKTPGDGTFKEQILGGKIAAFGVYDDPRKGGGHVVGGIIRHLKYQDVKKALETLYKLPTQRVLFEVLLRNDTPKPVEVVVDRVTVNRKLVATKSKMMLQAGKSILIGFSEDKLTRVQRRGWELLFTLDKG